MKSSFNDCYEAAGRLVSTMRDNAFLANGWIFSTLLRKHIRHAWVESEGNVFDYSNSRRIKTSIAFYYNEGRVKDVHLYRRRDAIKMLTETRRFEFWSIENRKKILGD